MKRNRLVASLLVLGVCGSIFTGCSQTDTNNSKGAKDVATGDQATNAENKEQDTNAQEPKKTIKFLSIWPEDKDNSKLIIELTEEYKQENPNFDMEFEFISPQDLTSKIKVLLASNDLPDVFAYESGAPLVELIDAHAVADIGVVLDERGIMDKLDEGAIDLLKTLVGGRGVYALPLGLNVEGIWYNKACFEQAGITEVPDTWDELLEACEKLKTAGIQPFASGGKDRWPLTRLVNAHLIRNVGADALEKVANGEAKMTDPAYVESARMIQEMASQGYFGVGVTTVDQGTAASMVMNGQAAMMYNGSWFTEDLVSDANAAGPEGIGLFNIPTVDGGAGSIDEYSMNCGNIIAFDAGKFDDVTADWMEYIVTNMGEIAMQQYGAFKGYKVDSMPTDVSTYTQLVADHINMAKGSALWFEARFDSKTTKIAQENSQPLFNNELTPEEYMKSIQESLDEK